jgi:hypothetical protein
MELPPVRFEALRWTQLVTAGQPVLFDDDGPEQMAYIRLVGACFDRWPRAGEGGGLCRSELTRRDPRSRELWGESYLLQMGLALLTAHQRPEDAGHSWLREFFDEPEFAELLADALAELEQPPPRAWVC